jgi:hypothetical protein
MIAGDQTRRDHMFFSVSAFYVFASILLGFARSYFLPGLVFARLPGWIVHVHGAIFVSWIFLYVLQTLLVGFGKVGMHRRLGIAAFLLAIAMIPAGTATALFSFVHDDGPPGVPRAFFLENNLTTILVLFPSLVAAAWRNRFRPAEHKRFILLANVAIVGAGILRWPIPAISHNGLLVSLFAYLPWLALFPYDIWTKGRVQRATVWGGLFLVVVDQSPLFLAQTASWNRIADSMLRFLGG